MKIATIVFTYHRSEHIRQVIEALSQSTQKPEKLFVFQDGIGSETNVAEWKKVGEIIKSIDWCETEIHISDTQKGCARSIIEGINYVFHNYEAIIVLEDDCVPHPQFISYMKQALEKYENLLRVYSIGGYAWDIDLPESYEDAYFNGRTSSWGWGTWKDRWKQFREDYRLIRKIEETEEGKKRLEIWGSDLRSMVIGNINGNCDSWAVFWSLTVIANDGVCLNPYHSLIHNIGMDGSGTHSVVRKDRWKYIEKIDKDKFTLPDEVIISKQCELEFCNMYSNIHGTKKFQLYQQVLLNWIKIKQKGKTLTKNMFSGSVAIWGKGKICDVLLQELEGVTDVKCIVESYPSTDKYREIPIYEISELPEEIKTIIVIPFFDMESISYRVYKQKKGIQLIGIDQLIDQTCDSLEKI